MSGLVKQRIIQACSTELYDIPIMDAFKRRDVIIIQALKDTQNVLSCTAHVFCNDKIIARRVGSGNAQSVYLDLPPYLEDAMITIQAEIDALDQEQSLVVAHLTRLLNLVDTNVEGKKTMHPILMDLPQVVRGLSELDSIVGQTLETSFLDVVKAFHERETQYSDVIRERLLTNLLLQG